MDARADMLPATEHSPFPRAAPPKCQLRGATGALPRAARGAAAITDSTRAAPPNPARPARLAPRRRPPRRPRARRPGARSPHVRLQAARHAVKLRREALLPAHLPRVVRAALGQVEQRARLARRGLRGGRRRARRGGRAEAFARGGGGARAPRARGRAGGRGTDSANRRLSKRGGGGAGRGHPSRMTERAGRGPSEAAARL
jgi:hypothetical protein